MYRCCQKCGKRLTDPESMIRGYGPECWGDIVRAYAKKIQGEEIEGQMSIFDFLKEEAREDGE